MRNLTRGLAVLLLIVGLGALSACSGDDSGGNSGDKKPSASSSGTSKDGGKTTLLDCKVEATLGGALKGKLAGKGRSVTGNPSGPKSFYQFTKGKITIQAYSKGESFQPSVVVNTQDGTFTSQPGAKGLDIKPSGKKASVDTEVAGVGGKTKAHVRATYTCK